MIHAQRLLGSRTLLSRRYPVCDLCGSVSELESQQHYQDNLDIQPSKAYSRVPICDNANRLTDSFLMNRQYSRSSPTSVDPEIVRILDELAD